MTLPSSRIPRFSQCEKIMRVLRDERWHTAAEIHQIAGFSRLNSRISELRKRGYLIEHETTGVGAAGSRYRLAGVTERDSLRAEVPGHSGLGYASLGTGQANMGPRSVTPEASTEEPSGDSSHVASASPSPEEPPCEATTGALSSVEQLELVA